MPILRNARHEKFAQAIAAGMTKDAAYVAAGFKPDRGNAARLTANDSVSERVAELQRKAEARFEMDRDAWLRRLKENADNCLDARDRAGERQALRELGLAMPGWYSPAKTEMDLTARPVLPDTAKLLENPATLEVLAKALQGAAPEVRERLRTLLAQRTCEC